MHGVSPTSPGASNDVARDDSTNSITQLTLTFMPRLYRTKGKAYLTLVGSHVFMENIPQIKRKYSTNQESTLQEIHGLPTENSVGNINNSVGN